MELQVTTALAAGVFLGLLLAAGLLLPRGLNDVVAVFLLGFGLFYGFRPLLFVLGLDVPFPEHLFPAEESAALLTLTLVGLTLYLACTVLGIAALTHTGARGWAPFFVQREVDIGRALKVTLLITALATALSAYLLARYGGIGGTVNAAKVDKALAGMFALKTIPAVGAVVGAATFLDARQRPGVPRWVPYVGLACAVLNGFSVFLWGSRSALVVIGAILILGLRSRRPRSTAGGQRSVLRIMVAVALVIAVAAGLRVARDTYARGEVIDVYADASMARQASIATNSIMFDAAMLSFRDWPSQRPYRGGEDFVNGTLGVVPRVLWADKPTAIPPGKWFRQVYEPQKINGWPMGAGALWYLNFGWLGLLLGGLLSGLVIGLVSAAQRRYPPSGFNTAVGVVLGVYVLSLGWDGETPMRIILWLVPLWLIARYVGRDPIISARRASPRTSPARAGRPGRPGD